MSPDLNLWRDEPRACVLPEDEALREITEPFREAVQTVKEPPEHDTR